MPTWLKFQLHSLLACGMGVVGGRNTTVSPFRLYIISLYLSLSLSLFPSLFLVLPLSLYGYFLTLSLSRSLSLTTE